VNVDMAALWTACGSLVESAALYGAGMHTLLCVETAQTTDSLFAQAWVSRSTSVDSASSFPTSWWVRP
jgi:hypothetical protein